MLLKMCALTKIPDRKIDGVDTLPTAKDVTCYDVDNIKVIWGNHDVFITYFENKSYFESSYEIDIRLTGEHKV
jgi:hypothetical protein